jgi:hypothetical protein
VNYLNGFGCRWPIPQRTAGPYRIIFLPPPLYQDLGFFQGVENLPVEQFITPVPIAPLYFIFSKSGYQLFLQLGPLPGLEPVSFAPLPVCLALGTESGGSLRRDAFKYFSSVFT